LMPRIVEPLRDALPIETEQTAIYDLAYMLTADEVV
jgi:hypothetical protein